MANSSVENFDAIIVLGAAQMPDGSSSPAIERRVARAAELWRDNVGERLILSGGKTISDIPEAETMADLARSMGVPNDVIELETQSTRTLENAVFSIEIIRRNGWRNVLVLTDDFHLTRAKFCFHALGQPVSMEKVSNPMTGIILFYWIRELVARLIYPRQVRAYQGRW